MRRAALLVCLILIGLFYWFGWPNPTGNTGSGNFSTPESTDVGDTDVLRIEIAESASQAQARYQAIVERYQDDAQATAWVKDCLTQSGANSVDQTQSWEIGCWRAWDELQSAGPGPD